MIHSLLSKQNYIQSANEANILSMINKGINTYDGLFEALNLSETVLQSELSQLTNNGMLAENKKGCYEWGRPVIGSLVTMEGDMFLPVNIVYMDDMIYLSRGESWYKVDLEFDLRRIVWNSIIPYVEDGEEKYDTTLMDMLRNSVNKTKKSRNKQLTEYENLRNKVVPYSEKLKLHLLTIGENQTDVEIVMIIPIKVSEDIVVEFRKFGIKQAIATEDLLTALRRPQNMRDFKMDIVLDKMIDCRDLFYSGNCIPVKWTNGDNKTSFEFAELSQVRKDNIKVTYKEYTNDGEVYITDEMMSPEELQQELSDPKTFPLLYEIFKENEFMFEF